MGRLGLRGHPPADDASRREARAGSGSSPASRRSRPSRRPPERDVLAEWSGLGYYARARNLHRAARLLEERGGTIPRSVEELRALPGIGPYTAAAVASIAFGVPVPLVDGNVARVLARLLAIPGDARGGRSRAAVEAAAGALLNPRSPGDHNQALMELGALVCLPRAPRCADVPPFARLPRASDGTAGGVSPEAPAQADAPRPARRRRRTPPRAPRPRRGLVPRPGPPRRPARRSRGSRPARRRRFAPRGLVSPDGAPRGSRPRRRPSRRPGAPLRRGGLRGHRKRDLVRGRPATPPPPEGARARRLAGGLLSKVLALTDPRRPSSRPARSRRDPAPPKRRGG